MRVALEEFDDAKHVVHALLGRAGASDLVTGSGIANILYWAIELFQRAEEHLTLYDAGAVIGTAMNDK